MAQQTTCLPAGRLRHRINIEKRSAGISTDRGKATGTWSTFAERIPAEIVSLTGREAEIARSTYGKATVKITIRHLPGLTRRHRVTFGNHVFNIGHVNNVNYEDRINVLLCSEEP